MYFIYCDNFLEHLNVNFNVYMACHCVTENVSTLSFAMQ